MSITARLKEYLAKRGLNPNRLSVATGLKAATVHKALSAGAGLHSDTLAAILRRYPEINPDWLLHGLGEMIRKAPDWGEVDMPASMAAEPGPGTLGRFIQGHEQLHAKARNLTGADAILDLQQRTAELEKALLRKTRKRRGPSERKSEGQ